MLKNQIINLIYVKWKRFDKNILFNEKSFVYKIQKEQSNLMKRRKQNVKFDGRWRSHRLCVGSLDYGLMLKQTCSNIQLPIRNRHLLDRIDGRSNRDSRFHYRVHRTNLLNLMIYGKHCMRSNAYASYDFC